MSESPIAHRLSLLQRRSDRIRNICVMAHVDHGKTTISDSLIASNGIITQRMSGKLRYMDSRKDEQERGITMKSSAISLRYLKVAANKGEEEEYLINLIDSPGHVDFAGEVSSAIQLCDGALILIDVVEGVCAQTKVSIRRAWSNDIKMVLILNKMDRLIVEMKLTPLDAYYHLQQILEQANAVVGELFTSDVLGRNSGAATTTEEVVNAKPNYTDEQVYDWSSGLEETDDSNLYFSPDQGNVVFASGIDLWGFRIFHFAKMYSQKLDIRDDVLLKTLWGDFYLNSKVKRIMKGAQAKAKRPLFVQFILENIWAAYSSVLEKRDKEMTEKIIKSLNIKLSVRDSKTTDPRSQLQAIFSQWLPLADTILEMVCEKLPSPTSISEERAEKLMCTKVLKFDSLPNETQKLKEAFCKCSSAPDAPTIVFVSKMFPFEKSSLPRRKPKLLTPEEIVLRREAARQRHLERTTKGEIPLNSESTNSSTPLELSSNTEPKLEKEVPEEEHTFVAFARIFSGTIRKGQQLYVLGPKHDPASALEKVALGISVDPSLKLEDLKPDEHVTLATIESLYLLMGRELEELDEVPAGCIFGIGQLEEHLIKSATLSSTVACPSFTDSTIHSIPIMRVAIEPVHPADMPQLVRGLKLLNQADASVRVLIQETGEHVVITAGEIHLQRCLDDLRERFAKVEINSSTPIVPFRETVVQRPKVDMVNEAIEETQSKDSNAVLNHLGLVVVKTFNKLSTIKMRSMPLPAKVVTILDEHAELIKSFDKFTNFARKKSSVGHEKSMIDSALSDTLFKSLESLKEKLREAFEASGSEWIGAVDQVWSFGPRRCGPNVLLLRAPQCNQPLYWTSSSVAISCSSDFDSSFLTGFQLATNSGPLCEEPMRGVCFVVEEWTIDELGETNENDSSVRGVDSERLNSGPFSGQLISAVREACRKAFQAQPQRLMAAMYSCNILVTADVLGKMYAVLSKRNGQVLHGDMQEGSTMFYVTAVLPVIESFDFASEIRRQTSGQALPQLTFSHWEVIETDPFWVPTTAEEYLLFGEKADSENRARKYVNLVRKRKGLAVDEKIVEHAEKQRTLAKKK